MAKKRNFKKLAELCTSKGDIFIAIDPSEGRNRIKLYFERNGEVKVQNLVSYRQGRRLLEESLKDTSKFDKAAITRYHLFESKIKEICESRGDVFIKLDSIEGKGARLKHQVHFERDGEVKVQHWSSYKRGSKVQVDYLRERQKWPEGQGLYKFYVKGQLVYVGKTTSFKNRLADHFKPFDSAGLKGRSQETNKYNELIDKIEICHMSNMSDRNIYEMYLIAKLSPVFNRGDTTEDTPSFELPELEFQEITGWR